MPDGKSFAWLQRGNVIIGQLKLHNLKSKEGVRELVFFYF